MSDFVKMKIREYFIEFSNNPRVVVANPDSPDDYRTGRVIEIGANGTIKVSFERGPGNAVAWFMRDELRTIREGVDIKIPKED